MKKLPFGVPRSVRSKRAKRSNPYFGMDYVLGGKKYRFSGNRTTGVGRYLPYK